MEAIFYGKGIIANEINHPNGRLLLLEEPETNLHPKLQSLLADFLVDVAKEFHITLLVETHSEYLIRKLQYLTAKKEITPADTAIYYFYDPENVPAGKKQVERIRIETDGSLDKDFGTGFFDEADNLAIDLFNITKAQRN
jgi:predicted ATPase